MTKLAGDKVQVLADGYELTGDSQRITIADMRDMYDVTTFGDGVHHFISGRRAVSFEHAGLANAAAARSHPVLKGAALNGIVSVLLGQNADPAIGDPVFSMAIRQGKYGVQPAAGAAVPFSARFVNKGELGGWGLALTPPVAFTTSTNGTPVNHGSATANGGAAFLHVLAAAASDTYTVVVEGSATGAFAGEETTLATFSLNGAQVGSERVAMVGSLPQYTRWRATRSGSAGDTVKMAVSLIRY